MLFLVSALLLCSVIQRPAYLLLECRKFEQIAGARGAVAHNPFRYWGDPRGRLPLISRTCQRCQQRYKSMRAEKRKRSAKHARRKRTAKPEPTISEKASSGVVNAYKNNKNSDQTPYPNSSNSMSAPSSPSKRTPGEELWLVHQRRTNSPHHDHADDEDDHDYEAPA